MHITAIEAALAAAAITAGAGVLGGLNIQRATRTREHTARIWDRQVEIYYSALLDVSRLASVREEQMERMHNVPPDNNSGEPEPPMENSERIELHIRLQLFASEKVHKAYSDSLTVHNKWSKAWNKMMTLRVSTSKKEDIAKSRNEVRAANTEASRRESDLIIAVQDDIHKPPSGVRGWRR